MNARVPAVRDVVLEALEAVLTRRSAPYAHALALELVTAVEGRRIRFVRLPDHDDPVADDWRTAVPTAQPGDAAAGAEAAREALKAAKEAT